MTVAPPASIPEMESTSCQGEHKILLYNITDFIEGKSNNK